MFNLYVVIKRNDINLLSQDVTFLINRGFRLIGGMTFDFRDYCQALTKKYQDINEVYSDCIFYQLPIDIEKLQKK